MARNKKKQTKGQHVHTISTWDLIKRLIEAKLPALKVSATTDKAVVPSPPQSATINHIAIILDGKVEEIIRAQNRLAALLLSGPTFVEYDPSVVTAVVGETLYEDGRLINPVKTDDLESQKNTNG